MARTDQLDWSISESTKLATEDGGERSFQFDFMVSFLEIITSADDLVARLGKLETRDSE